MNTLNKEAELIYILEVLHSFPFDFLLPQRFDYFNSQPLSE